MTMVTNIRPLTPALPEVVGYVEAMTSDRLLGWAWAPAHPDIRAGIELRLNDTIVANTLANLPRSDLVNNGIGDGRHAYDLEIPVEFRDRAAELRVFARLASGDPVPIGAPPVAEGLSEQMTRLLRSVDILLNSQRVIHRNLQTALTAPKDIHNQSAMVGLTRLEELQDGIQVQVSAVERFVARLDDHLSRISSADVNSSEGLKGISPAAVWALAFSTIALVVSMAGLVHALGS